VLEREDELSEGRVDEEEEDVVVDVREEEDGEGKDDEEEEEEDRVDGEEEVEFDLVDAIKEGIIISFRNCWVFFCQRKDHYSYLVKKQTEETGKNLSFR
jgi:hypothetical protein